MLAAAAPLLLHICDTMIASFRLLCRLLCMYEKGFPPMQELAAELAALHERLALIRGHL
jgi:hypothetical protein